jgi:hypothetical protein
MHCTFNQCDRRSLVGTKKVSEMQINDECLSYQASVDAAESAKQSQLMPSTWYSMRSVFVTPENDWPDCDILREGSALGYSN